MTSTSESNEKQGVNVTDLYRVGRAITAAEQWWAKLPPGEKAFVCETMGMFEEVRNQGLDACVAMSAHGPAKGPVWKVRVLYKVPTRVGEAYGGE